MTVIRRSGSREVVSLCGGGDSAAKGVVGGSRVAGEYTMPRDILFSYFYFEIWPRNPGPQESRVVHYSGTFGS